MNEKIFRDGMNDLAIEISDGQVEKFNKYSALLKEWNEKMNLTAVVDDDGIAVKHFLDSILPLSCVDFDKVKSVIDVGTGAGFPGVPMAIMMPDTKFTLFDSLNKRINFLNAVKEEAGMNNITCIHGRAEEFGKKEGYREEYDMAVSRAVANMTVLCEYCLPFVKVGGCFVALKAEGAEEEISDAKTMIETLGGKIEDMISVSLPQSDITRLIVVVRKVKKTPEKYPRRADKIKKK